ncbi:MAG: plastocyanin/azurin family copper-binding protein [Thermomicrobiales bacterium]
MNRRRFVALAPLAGLAMIPLRHSHAGGWASVEIVDRPDVIEAGQPTELALVIKQHGISPVDIDPLIVSASNTKTGDSIEETATKSTGAGNYAVVLTFPTNGIWELIGTPGGFAPFEMGPVEVGLATSEESLAAPGGAVVIDITGGMGSGNFEPGAVEIAAGTLVIWTNNSVEGHTIVIDGATERSGLIGPGAAYARLFSEPGTYQYVCGPHPAMTGTIEVV